jgi:hypothetical protein
MNFHKLLSWKNRCTRLTCVRYACMTICTRCDVSFVQISIGFVALSCARPLLVNIHVVKNAAILPTAFFYESQCGCKKMENTAVRWYTWSHIWKRFFNSPLFVQFFFFLFFLIYLLFDRAAVQLHSRKSQNHRVTKG